jgi:23S rRNA pseudouridine1911/1915/1917 synthase
VFVRSFDWLPKPAAGKLRILYEDAWLIALDKPAGLPTHETKDLARPSLTQLVERHVGRRVFVHHRLDAGTSGVVLFAKAPEANPALARSFAGREVEKTYVALVAVPKIEWPSVMSIDSPISVAANGSVRVDGGGVPAMTRVRVLERGADTLLIEAKPITGRKHQIRVHLASVGAPIVGDSRYGGSGADTGRLMLHAERLELEHPVTGKRLVVSSPRPDEFRSTSLRSAEAVQGRVPSRSSRPLRPGADPRPAKPNPRSRTSADRRRETSSHTTPKRRKTARGSARGSRR